MYDGQWHTLMDQSMNEYKAAGDGSSEICISENVCLS
jgi:hypothetical protein